MPEINTQQELLRSLMSAYPEIMQQDAGAQVALQRQKDRMDRTKMGGRGLLGIAAGMIGNHMADKRRPEYQQAMVDAMMAKSRSTDMQDQIKRFRDISQHGIEADQTAGAGARYRAETDWEHYMQNPEMYKNFKDAGRSAGVTINNNPNANFTKNPDGSVTPVKGSSEWYKRQQDAKKEKAAAEAAKTKSVSRTAGIQRAGGTVIQDLGRALELTPKMMGGDGVIGANARLASSKIPGTSEFYINEFMDSAKSNIGLDKLQQMRESSPTGGALGQVPIAQQLRLEKVLGQADVTMTPKMMTDNMHRIQNIYFDIMYGSKPERELAIEQGKMTQEDSDRIDAQYNDLSFDEFGKRKSDSKSAQGKDSQDQIYVNPQTGEKIRWNGSGWVVVK